jgi:large repetitive protein
LNNGTTSLYVKAIDQAGNLSTSSNLLNIAIVSVASDYNGDSYSDAAVYVRDTTDNEGLWFVAPTSLVPASPAPPPFWFNSGTPLGTSNAIPFQGDFDGDGQTDLAYYVPSTATWGMVDSKSKTFTSFALGTPNVSVPISGYFDANAPDEIGVFTIQSGMGVWSIVTATSGVRTVLFGAAGDIPVPGDYLGLGTDQIAVYRPSNGDFYVMQPNGSVTTLNPGVGGSPDLSSLVPVPGAYDNLAYFTAGKAERTEAAVFDPKTGVYTILGPNGAYNVSQGFQAGDIPAPADYAGTGSTQAVVYRPSTGQFIEAGGTVIYTFAGPTTAFIPITSPLSYRTPAVTAPPPSTGTTGTGTTGTGMTTGTGTTGTSTGTGTTGTSTGTGSGSSTSTGTGTGTSGGSGTGSATGTGSTGTSTTPAKSPVSAPGSQKKPVPKKPVPPKKTIKKAPPKKAAPKKVEHPPKLKIVVVVPAKKTVKVVAKPAKTKATHVVDVALETVHVNLRKKG